MNEQNFKGVNLSLLVVFVVLMRERSTTRAAEKLDLSQPAVSHSLKRLRLLFKDDLFTRVSQGVVPTPRALALLDDLLPLMQTIETTLAKRPTAESAVPARSLQPELSGAL